MISIEQKKTTSVFVKISFSIHKNQTDRRGRLFLHQQPHIIASKVDRI